MVRALTWPDWYLPPVSALKRLLCQEIQRQLVGFAVEVCEQRVVEEGVVGGNRQKQGYAGPEFQMVGIAEDLLSAASFHIQNKLGTFLESNP
jgi:hypothetical protein